MSQMGYIEVTTILRLIVHCRSSTVCDVMESISPNPSQQHVMPCCRLGHASSPHIPKHNGGYTLAVTNLLSQERQMHIFAFALIACLPDIDNLKPLNPSPLWLVKIGAASYSTTHIERQGIVRRCVFTTTEQKTSIQSRDNGVTVA